MNNWNTINIQHNVYIYIYMYVTQFVKVKVINLYFKMDSETIDLS